MTWRGPGPIPQINAACHIRPCLEDILWNTKQAVSWNGGTCKSYDSFFLPGFSITIHFEVPPVMETHHIIRIVLVGKLASPFFAVWGSIFWYICSGFITLWHVMKTMWRWTPIFLESKLLLVKKAFHSMVEYGEITMFPWFSPGVPVVFARKFRPPRHARPTSRRTWPLTRSARAWVE